jgi:hypothetical protein
MKITCPNCGRVINLRQKSLYHAGFSNMGFLYCDTCPSILEFSTFNPNYTRIVGDKHPWMLNEEEKRLLEEHLAPCPRGGHFRFDAYPHCPYCNNSLASLIPDNIHFLEIGDVIDGDKDQTVWI